MLLIALWVASISRAELPLPTFPECGEPDRPDLCPSDLDEDWARISYILADQQASVRPAELEIGSGLHADRAWRTTTGRFDVLICVADSGVQWDNQRLVNKWYINTQEVPLPQDADGVESSTYDLNGDGLVNVQDWAEDPRVDWTIGRDEADGILDPSDLIYTFSDGIDDDANGYVADIAGWDFFGHDNDAAQDYRSGYGDHGDGVAEEAAAEGGDEENGQIGICPNCAVLAVRTGDTFVTDGIRAGEAIAFAADSGARAMTMAMGALSNPQSTEAAAAYAFDMGLTLVGAAGDENAYHHNFPAVLDNIIYTHSIRHNTADDNQDVLSYLNTWNCNNFGDRMLVVAPSSACATGAVASITGMVGLLHSAAMDVGITLDAGEVEQLLIGTSDDIWLSEEDREETRAYPSEEGWDPFFGYGRVNAEAAVEAIAAGEIPPWASIDSPRWFETRESGGGMVEISGRVSAKRADSFTYVVEVGFGHDPRTWEQLASGSGQSTFEGVLASLDPTTIPVVAQSAEPEADEGIVDRLERVDQPAVTVRVRVTDSDGLEGEQRKTFFVHEDQDLMPGFPFQLGGSGESSPILADLDGDGIFEIIIGTGSGEVWALDGEGTPLDGWPVQVADLADPHTSAPFQAAHGPWRDGISASVAVGDLDGDGTPEIVASTLFGAVYVWEPDGSEFSGFPVHAIGREPAEFDDDHTYDQGFMGAPTLADLDGDGQLEIIGLGMDSRLYAWTADGGDYGPYPMEICYPSLCGEIGTRAITSPAVGDIDGDGDLDLAFGTNESPGGHYSVTYVVDANTGLALEGWPHQDSGLVNEAVLLPLVGEGHPASGARADLAGDGDLEISSPVMLGTTDIYNAQGETYLDVPFYGEDFDLGNNVDLVPTFVEMVSNPAFGDLNQDGTPDYVLGGANTIYLVSLALTQWKEYQQAVGAWSGKDASFLPGWPRQIEDLQFLMAPAIADVSGDGAPEAIYGSAGYMVHAWDANGIEAEGWPKFTGNWLLGSPAVGDIDGDGYLDVVVSTREGWLFAWSTAGHADQAVQWAALHHDAQNTGNYETALPTQLGPPPVIVDAKGCCKKSAKDSGAAWLLILPLGLGGLMRRRRR